MGLVPPSRVHLTLLSSRRFRAYRKSWTQRGKAPTYFVQQARLDEIFPILLRKRSMAKKIYCVENCCLDVNVAPVLEENLFKMGLVEFRPTMVLPLAGAECHFAHPADVLRTEGVDCHVCIVTVFTPRKGRFRQLP